MYLGVCVCLRERCMSLAFVFLKIDNSCQTLVLGFVYLINDLGNILMQSSINSEEL